MDEATNYRLYVFMGGLFFNITIFIVDEVNIFFAYTVHM